MRLWVPVVFIFAIVVLGIGIERASIASQYSDPIGRVRAQDESFHVSAALAMARSGDWGTPLFLDRPFLFKPPLLIWLSTAAVKTLGTSLIALRLPAVVFGALCAVVVYLWGRFLRSTEAGIIAACLLLSNPIWHTFSRLVYTDVIAGTAAFAAVLFVVADPPLALWRTRIGFAAGMASAVMAKNIAGLLPLLALVVFLALSRTPWKAAARALASVILLAGAAIAPWHIYQLICHPQWFVTEYVKIQMFSIGLNPPTNSAEPHIVFYLKRLFLTDPVLVLMAVIAAVMLVRHWKRDCGAAQLMLVSWLVVATLALAAFRARNLPYLTFLVPSLCVLAASRAPDFLFRRFRFTLAALLAVFVLKSMASDAPWALRYGASPAAPATARLRWYQSLGRGNQLIIVDPDDDFYSATLGLSHVRYLLIDPSGLVDRYGAHYRQLGIALTSDEFLALDKSMGRYKARLEDWRLDSAAPIGTVITTATVKGVMQVVQFAPDADFDIPRNLMPLLGRLLQKDDHRPAEFEDRCILLANRAAPYRLKAALPPNW